MIQTPSDFLPSETSKHTSWCLLLSLSVSVNSAGISAIDLYLHFVPVYTKSMRQHHDFCGANSPPVTVRPPAHLSKADWNNDTMLLPVKWCSPVTGRSTSSTNAQQTMQINVTKVAESSCTQ